MSDRKSNKQVQELLLPGDRAWQRWRSAGAGAFEVVETIEFGPGRFHKDASHHILALPATSAWVLPAWIKTEATHLRDAASLHLERLSVRTPEHSRAMIVDSLSEKDGSHLARIIALKDVPTPLANLSILPKDCRLSAACYPLPASSIVIWRELERLVMAITQGPRLVYFSPLSALTLDSNAVSEVNHICLQLSFQRVVTELTGITLWTEEGDASLLQRGTGMTVQISDKPLPRPAAITAANGLMPADLLVAKDHQAASSKRRLVGLSAGFVLAACVAAFAVLIGLVSRERDALLDQVAALSPRASKVEGQKAAWEEAGSAIDPTASPMETLLRIMEPTASSQITITELEWSPKSVIIRGRAPEISPALQYVQEIKDAAPLLAYTWEPGTPEIGENGAAFEVKGERP
jgi:hypothetical protein